MSKTLEKIKRKKRLEEKAKELAAPKQEAALVALDDSTFFLGPPEDLQKIEVYKSQFGKISSIGNNRRQKKEKMAAAIQMVTGDGEELWVHALRTMRGELETEVIMPTAKGPKRMMRKPSLEEQQKARDWLANRGFGKEAAIIEVSNVEDEDTLDLEQLSTEELAAYLRLQRKARKGEIIDVTPEGG